MSIAMNLKAMCGNSRYTLILLLPCILQTGKWGMAQNSVHRFSTREEILAREMTFDLDRQIQGALDVLWVESGVIVHVESPRSAGFPWRPRVSGSFSSVSFEDVLNHICSQFNVPYTWELCDDGENNAVVLFPSGESESCLGVPVECSEFDEATVMDLVVSTDVSDEIRVQDFSESPIIPTAIVGPISNNPADMPLDLRDIHFDVSDLGETSLRRALTMGLLRADQGPGLVFTAQWIPYAGGTDNPFIRLRNSAGEFLVPRQQAVTLRLRIQVRRLLNVTEPAYVFNSEYQNIGQISPDATVNQWVTPTRISDVTELLSRTHSLSINNQIQDIVRSLSNITGVAFAIESPRTSRPNWVPRVRLRFNEAPLSEILDALVSQIEEPYTWSVFSFSDRAMICIYPNDPTETWISTRIDRSDTSQITLEMMVDELFPNGEVDLEIQDSRSGPGAEPPDEVANVLTRPLGVPSASENPTLRELICKSILSQDNMLITYEAYWASDDELFQQIIQSVEPDYSGQVIEVPDSLFESVKQIVFFHAVPRVQIPEVIYSN